MSTVVDVRPGNEGYGLIAGDRIAALAVTVPEEPVLARASITYTDAMTMSEDQLRTLFREKAVFIANSRPPAKKDVHPHPGGRQVHGVWAQACAFDALDRSASMRFPTPTEDAALMAAFALVGAIAGSAGASGMRGRFTFFACLAVASIVAMIAVYALAGLMINVLVQLAGAWLAWEAGAAGSRLRRA
jgi:hypothetical protein